MAKDAKVAVFSVVAGGIIVIVVVVIGAILDMYMNPKLSNIISLVIGMFINFFLQQTIFVEGALTETRSQIYRYVVTDVVILGSNQWLFTYLIENEDIYADYLPNYLQEHYESVCRVIVGGIVWIMFSFPLRKYWVFVPKQNR